VRRWLAQSFFRRHCQLKCCSLRKRLILVRATPNRGNGNRGARRGAAPAAAAAAPPPPPPAAGGRLLNPTARAVAARTGQLSWYNTPSVVDTDANHTPGCGRSIQTNLIFDEGTMSDWHAECYELRRVRSNHHVLFISRFFFLDVYGGRGRDLVVDQRRAATGH